MAAAQSSDPAAAASAFARAPVVPDPPAEPDGEKQMAAHNSPVARLYRHAIESIFAFLPLADLSRVLNVSRSWSSSVRSMGSISVRVVDPRGRSGLIAASPLGRHVGQIGAPSDAAHDAVRPALTNNDLFILSRHLVSLTSLACSVKLPQPSRLFFGPSLHTVDLGLGGKNPGAINEAILTISRLPTLTDLRLELPAFFPALNFALLASAPALRDLTLRCAGLVEPAQPQLDQLRTLTHLCKMCVDGLSLDGLTHLLRPPHSLQWQQIPPVDGIDDAGAAVLSTLPSLTALETSQCSSVAFLPSLTRMRTLALHMDGSARLAADIVAGLACCPQLTELTLEAEDVTASQLSQAISHLPLLRLLHLPRCPALESLSFLSECAHLAHSLQALELNCRNTAFHSSQLKHILSLPSLTELSICSSFAGPLDACASQLLTSPSVLLPKLVDSCVWRG